MAEEQTHDEDLAPTDEESAGVSGGAAQVHPGFEAMGDEPGGHLKSHGKKGHITKEFKLKGPPNGGPVT